VKSWTIFEEATGRITRWGGSSNPKNMPKLKPGERRLDDVRIIDGAKRMIAKDGRVVGRPELSVTSLLNGQVGRNEIGRLPAGTKVYRRGFFVGESDGGMLSIDIDAPRQEEIRLVPPFPYQECTVQVVVGSEDIAKRQDQAARRRRQIMGAPLTGLRAELDVS